MVPTLGLISRLGVDEEADGKLRGAIDGLDSSTIADLNETRLVHVIVDHGAELTR